MGPRSQVGIAFPFSLSNVFRYTAGQEFVKKRSAFGLSRMKSLWLEISLMLVPTREARVDVVIEASVVMVRSR